MPDGAIDDARTEVDLSNKPPSMRRDRPPLPDVSPRGSADIGGEPVAAGPQHALIERHARLRHLTDSIPVRALVPAIRARLEARIDIPCQSPYRSDRCREREGPGKLRPSRRHGHHESRDARDQAVTPVSSPGSARGSGDRDVEAVGIWRNRARRAAGGAARRDLPNFKISSLGCRAARPALPYSLTGSGPSGISISTRPSSMRTG